MGMIKVEKFLCFSLETGGLVIGCFTLAGSALASVLSIVGLILLSILSCRDLEALVDENGDEFNAESCEIVRIVFIVALVVVAVLGFAFAVIGWLCISGTRQRNHNRIKPMVVLLAVYTICMFLNVLEFTPSGILAGLLGGLLYGYLLVCIYSLFYKIREEFERGFNPHYQVKAGEA